MSDARDKQRRLYRLARHQGGVVGRSQLIDADISRTTIESWLKAGRLIPGFEGTYSLGRPIDSASGWWMAAILAAGEGAVLAGPSAAKALGFGSREGTIEVGRPAGRRRVLRPRVHPGRRAEIRKVALLPEDVAKVGPVPAMTASRALLDIAGRSSPALLRREFIEAGRHGFLGEDALEECRQRGLGFQGHSRLVWLADAWSSGSGRIRSQMEGEFRLFCFERRLPPPVTNAMVKGVEVDALWEHERVVVELDSRQFHGDGFAFENDRGKSNRLIVEGYKVLRITWKMLKGDPEGVYKMVRAALGCD